MNNNNNIGWLFFGGYKNILPSMLTILPSSSTRAILLTSLAIYSCIPLKAIQYYKNVSTQKFRSRTRCRWHSEILTSLFFDSSTFLRKQRNFLQNHPHNSIIITSAITNQIWYMLDAYHFLAKIPIKIYHFCFKDSLTVRWVGMFMSLFERNYKV